MNVSTAKADEANSAVFFQPLDTFNCMTSLKARLSKAKARLFGTATKDIVVPFELPCDCGHRVSGIRRASWQIATCSTCDSRIYVLPVNVYPATKRVRSEVLDGSVANRLSVIVRDLVVGESESAPDSSASTNPTSTNQLAAKSSARRTGPPTDPDEDSPQDDAADVSAAPSKRSRRGSPHVLNAQAAALVAEPILVEEPVVRVPRPSIAVIARRIFTPFRMLMLSAVVLIAATGWWVVTQRRMDDARKTWRREMDVAEKALDEKDISTLGDSLAKAVAAGQILQRDDAEARRASSLWLQTKALQELSPTDLISMLSGCTNPDGRLDAAKAATAAESLSGKWFVFESVLIRSDSGLQADMSLIIDSVPVAIFVDSDVLQHAVTAMSQSPLLFVASVKSCEVVDGGRGLQIRLDGDSCTLVTTEFHAAEFGFTSENTSGLDALLERQTAFLKSDAASANKGQQR